jgi:uncharacterized protein
MLERLISRGSDYFDPLFEIASRSVGGAELLRAALEAPARAEEACDQLEGQLRESRETFHRLRVRINTIAITPIDRDELHLLGTGLTKVAELIRDAALRVVLYGVSERHDAAVALTGVLHGASERVRDAIGELSHGRATGPALAAVSEAEKAGDALYFEAMGALFRERRDALEVLKCKDIYTLIEDAIDECHHVADVIEEVAVGHI